MPITREEAARKGRLTLQETLEYDPEFFQRRKAQGENFEPVFDGNDGTVNSRFEQNVYYVEVDEEGNALFGRLYKVESPNVNVALIDSERGLIGLNIQVRRVAGGHFAQPAMGFNLNRLTGTNQAESNQAAAIRESLEENGVTVVRSIEPLGVVMVNPTSVISESTIFVLDCDSEAVTEQLDFAEGIRKAIWITPRELLARINAGTHGGIRYDHGPLLWTTMKLLASRPELIA